MKSYVCGILFLMYIGLVPSTEAVVYEYCRWGHGHMKAGGITVRPCMHVYCNPQTGLINSIKCPILRCDPGDNVLRAPPNESKEFPDCCPLMFCATNPTND